MENLLSEGLELMVFGMGFVIAFLTLLVFATTGMSAFVGKYFPEAPAAPKAKRAVTAAATAGNNDELIAVMTAAVHKHRS